MEVKRACGEPLSPKGGAASPMKVSHSMPAIRTGQHTSAAVRHQVASMRLGPSTAKPSFRSIASMVSKTMEKERMYRPAVRKLRGLSTSAVESLPSLMLPPPERLQQDAPPAIQKPKRTGLVYYVDSPASWRKSRKELMAETAAVNAADDIDKNMSQEAGEGAARKPDFSMTEPAAKRAALRIPGSLWRPLKALSKMEPRQSALLSPTKAELKALLLDEPASSAGTSPRAASSRGASSHGPSPRAASKRSCSKRAETKPGTLAVFMPHPPEASLPLAASMPAITNGLLQLPSDGQSKRSRSQRASPRGPGSFGDPLIMRESALKEGKQLRWRLPRKGGDDDDASSSGDYPSGSEEDASELATPGSPASPGGRVYEEAKMRAVKRMAMRSTDEPSDVAAERLRAFLKTKYGDLRKAFKALSPPGKGFMTCSDLHLALQMAEINWTAVCGQEKLQRIFVGLDVRGVGRLTVSDLLLNDGLEAPASEDEDWLFLTTMEKWTRWCKITDDPEVVMNKTKEKGTTRQYEEDINIMKHAMEERKARQRQVMKRMIDQGVLRAPNGRHLVARHLPKELNKEVVQKFRQKEMEKVLNKGRRIQKALDDVKCNRQELKGVVEEFRPVCSVEEKKQLREALLGGAIIGELTKRDVNGFCENEALSRGEKETRDLARELGMSIPDVEAIQAEHSRFNKDGEGVTRASFPELLKALHDYKNSDLEDELVVNKLWRSIDKDNNGRIDFEEYLVWHMEHLRAPQLGRRKSSKAPASMSLASGLGRQLSDASTEASTP
eukprot:TRINITY_DN32701_c0_g2_i1.p1 TRINITY_DN32701_c0_g2~~TRINITY_DN32701_c0_g2_i1.p1  ORF type:complete len:783 (+),score=218.71 TRINITY_DN32701_c0_g2_i1:119-2467(+)